MARLPVVSRGFRQEPKPGLGALPASALTDTRGTTEGDLLVYDADENKFIRKGVGTDGQVLIADSATDGGVKWAAGGGGTSEPFTPLDSLSGTPRSVTDWGALINTAYGNGARHFIGGPYDYPFTTPLTTGAGANGLGFVATAFEGVSGLRWSGLPPQGAATRFVWKGGASSGRGFDLRSSDGVVFHDLALMYDNAAYDGDLIDCGTLGGASPPSSYPTFERCHIGAQSAVSARCLFKLDQCVYPILKKLGMAGAAHGLIRGYETGGTIAGNDGVFEQLQLSGGIGLMNIGLNWRMRDITFEFTDAAMTAGIDSDVTCSSVFWADNLTFWDAVNNSQVPVQQRAANYWDATIRGGSTASAFVPVLLNLLGPGLVRLENFQLGGRSYASGGTPLVDVGTAGAGALKDLLRIVGCYQTASSDLDLGAIANLDGGHAQIEVSGNRRGGSREIRTLAGQERLGYTGGTSASYTPAVAQHSGQTHLSGSAAEGNDIAGIIYLVTSGGASTAGLAVDVTFAKPLIPGYLGPSTKTPFVELGLPIEDGGVGLSASAAAGYAAQPYAKITASSTGFSIGTVNAIPNNTCIGLAYRIVMK